MKNESKRRLFQEYNGIILGTSPLCYILVESV